MNDFSNDSFHKWDTKDIFNFITVHDSHPLWPYVWWNDTVQYICICLSMCQNLWFINYQSNEGITFDVLLICEILKHFDTRAHNMLIPNNLINSITVRWNFSMTGSYFFQPEVISFNRKLSFSTRSSIYLLVCQLDFYSMDHIRKQLCWFRFRLASDHTYSNCGQKYLVG